jgi:hypothetical protein
MDLSKVNDWLQVIGVFGVIASLIFVGIQLKQTQDIALAGTYNARASTTVDANAGVLSTPQFYSGMAKIYSGRRDQLTAEEYIALEQELNIFLTIYENNHYQYTMGFLPEEHWQKNLVELDCRMTEPFQRSIAEDWLARENFREVLDNHIERGRKATESCWVSSAEEPWQFFNPVE